MLINDPKVVASSNLGLELANAFGVICNPSAVLNSPAVPLFQR